MTNLRTLPSRLLFFSLWSLVLIPVGCAASRQPRVTVVTGTTIGLKVTPGDGQTRPPQVTFGYKRAELAIIPTKGGTATKDASDAFSTLAAFFFSTEWVGQTEIASFIATGHSARAIQTLGQEFSTAFAHETLGVVSEEIQKRRLALGKDWEALGGEDEAKRVLDFAGLPVKPNRTPKASLLDAIKDAQTTSQLMVLESAFMRAR